MLTHRTLMQPNYTVQDLSKRITRSETISFTEQNKTELNELIKRIDYPTTSPLSPKEALYFITKEVAYLIRASVRGWSYAEQMTAFYDTHAHRTFIQANGKVLTPALQNSEYAHYIPGGLQNVNFYAFWDLKDNCWQSSTLNGINDNCLNSHSTLKAACQTQLQKNYRDIKASEFSLLSPTHIAALIGDVNLMRYLLGKELRADENFNQWQLTPLEIAVMSEAIPMINYLLGDLRLRKNVDQALKLAVEKGSFQLIACLLDHQVPITDEALQVATRRDKALADYLSEKRKSELKQAIFNKGSLGVLQEMLDFQPVSIQLMAELIYADPAVLTSVSVANNKNGNTLLHELVAKTQTAKVTALLRAVDAAKWMPGSKVFFDIDNLKNAQQQTVMRLAFAGKNQDMINTLIIHAGPSLDKFDKELMDNNIKIGECMRKREQITKENLKNLSDVVLEQKQVIAHTNQNVSTLAIQQQAMVDHLNATSQELYAVNQQLNAVMHQLNVVTQEKLSQRNEMHMLSQDMIKLREENQVLRNKFDHVMQGLQLLLGGYRNNVMQNAQLQSQVQGIEEVLGMLVNQLVIAPQVVPHKNISLAVKEQPSTLAIEEGQRDTITYDLMSGITEVMRQRQLAEQGLIHREIPQSAKEKTPAYYATSSSTTSTAASYSHAVSDTTREKIPVAQPITSHGALLDCARTGDAEGLEKLILQGANIHYGKNSADTSLLYCLLANVDSLKYVQALKCLIKHGVDVNATITSSAGKSTTALHFAVERALHLNFYDQLIEAGADMNSKVDGRTVLEILHLSGTDRVALIKHMEKKIAEQHSKRKDLTSIATSSYSTFHQPSKFARLPTSATSSYAPMNRS